MFPVYCYLAHFRFHNPRKRIHNHHKHTKSGRLPHYPPTNIQPSRMSSSSNSVVVMTTSNLNTLLKTQIRAAIEAIYSNQGTNDAHIFDGPASVSKALLDILFPQEVDHNAEVTGVIKVPTVADGTVDAAGASDSEGSTESKKERKKRAPMSDEAKAQMKAKREATIAAKKAPEQAPAPPATPEKAKAEAPTEPEAPGAPVKERKARGPMSEEAKAAMKAKREATIAAKKAAV